MHGLRLALGKLAQALLMIRRDQARRYHEFRGILDRQIERDHFAGLYEDDEAGGRVRTVRHEHGDHRIAVADFLVYLERRLAGEEHDGIEAAARKLDQADALERPTI